MMKPIPDDDGFYTGVIAITRSPLDNLAGYKVDLIRINQDTGMEEIIGKIVIHEIIDVNDLIEDDMHECTYRVDVKMEW